MQGQEQKPEIVIALAGPVGTDLHLLAETISEKMSAYSYRCEQIRVSKLIQQFCDKELKSKIENEDGGEKIKLLMQAGDQIRSYINSGDALVPAIVTAIRGLRKNILKESGKSEDNIPAFNTCYIIDSLKHPQEVETLRGIYSKNFILLSGFSSVERRQESLCDLIAKANTSTENKKFTDQAIDLIETDAKRPGSEIGQSLRDTFPKGDFFIRVSGDFSQHLDRFLDLYFSKPYITPYPHEYFMFEAHSKALRSADLSRQVGATIVDNKNHIISSGCNEVPIAGGGSYWPGMKDEADNRDWVKGRDFNAVKKFEIIDELLSFLEKNKVVTLNGDCSVSEATRELLFGTHRKGFKELRVSNLIEFGRVVHAEMNAITDAARRGIEVGGGILYCTTFPCHMCARHIISAGIRKVVYIEPYPKSMTQELFPETVVVDSTVAVSDERKRFGDIHPPVSFEPFEGVAPSIYAEMFRSGNRKNREGYVVNWSRSTAIPKIAVNTSAHLNLENTVAMDVDRLSEVSLSSNT